MQVHICMYRATTRRGVTPCRPRLTPLLNRISQPADLRNLSTAQLRQLANELRTETIDAALVERLAHEHPVLITIEEKAQPALRGAGDAAPRGAGTARPRTEDPAMRCRTG
jgi:hypothetical protein